MRLSDWDKTVKPPVRWIEQPAPSSTARGSSMGSQSPALAPPGNALAPVDPLAVYGAAVAAAREIVSGVSREGTRVQAREAARDIVLALQSDPSTLLALANRSTPGNYLYAHAANTAILAARVAQGLDLSFELLGGVAEAALWHDLALGLHLGLCRLGRPIPADRVTETLLHPLDADNHLRGMGEIAAAFQEKLPWLVGRETWTTALTLAQLVGLCSLYEAITHDRSWRARFLASPAVRMTSAGHNHAPCRTLAKPFLSQLSLYPVGSWVRLSNQELAQVVRVETGVVLRPEVAVYAGGDGRLNRTPVLVDLMKSPLIHVTEPVDPLAAFQPYPLFLNRLRLAQWWLP